MLWPLAAESKDSHLQVFHGASRTHTGDLLGAIPVLRWAGIGLVEPVLRFSILSPNMASPVLQ